MDTELLKYLKKVRFDRQYKELINGLKDKSIIIYGTGQLFKLIKDNYDLSKLNIIGISDKKFSIDDEGDYYLGYKIIPSAKIFENNPDYILVATLKYLNIVKSFMFSNKNKYTKVKPLVKRSFMEDLAQVLFY